jgi:pimeloyl-ACP methyl ester carboxylesterase
MQASAAPMQPVSRFVDVNRVRIHYLEAGSGEAVILCHGFPELALSWRHQLPVLAAAGYRAIAPDMRGHGKSEIPAELGAYDVLHTVGDIIGLMDALSINRAVLIGHDAGTTTAYSAALMRPDRIRAVVGLSVPYIPRGPLSLIEALSQVVPPGFYMRYFQEEGVAERDLEADPRESLRRLFFANSGENPEGPIVMMVPDGGGLVEGLAAPPGTMEFMPDDVLEHYVAAYRSTGFRGGLNGYRVFDRNWQLTAPWDGMALPVPAAYIGGTKDTVLGFPGFREAAEAMTPALFLEGAGHWIQAERPDEVNQAILGFLKTPSNGDVL